MIKIYNEGISYNCSKFINIIISDIIDDFIEVGSHMDFECIYGDVFPMHMIQDEEKCIKTIRELSMYTKDNFIHTLKPLHQYVLYNILEFSIESTDDGFNLVEIVKEYMQKYKCITNSFSDIEENLVYKIESPDIFKDICFEDYDFSERFIDSMLAFLKQDIFEGTKYLDYFNIDIEYIDEYIDLMPHDKQEELLKLKEVLNKKLTKDIKSCEDFERIVDDIIKEIKFYTEQKGLYKTLKKEKILEDDFQKIFYIIINEKCKRYDLDISCEADSGRGRIDFKISKGREYRCLIEFKLDKNGCFESNFNFQLSTYLNSEDVYMGIFLLFIYNDSTYEKIEYYKTRAYELSKEYNKLIKFEAIDLRDKKSASKIRSREEQ